MQLPVLATLAAVAVVAIGGPLTCDDHCRIKFSMQLMLRAHDSICDCSKLAKAGRQPTPVLAEGTTFQLNDDGAYYNIEKPFHILNPTVNFRRKPSKAPNNVAIHAPSVDTNNAKALSSHLFHTPIQDSTMVGTNITTRISEPLLIAPADTKDDNISAQIKISKETSKTLVTEEPFNNKIRRLSTRSGEREDNSQSSDYLDNLTSNSEMQDRAVAQRIPIRDLKSAMNDDDADNKTSNRSNNKYPNPTTKSQYKKAFGLETVIYAEGRPVYDENEVSPQRVITREFVNGTVQSVINGTEDMNREASLNNENNDSEFVDVAFVISSKDWDSTDNPMDASGTDLGDTEMDGLIHSHG
ncbi:unnamed protein product, partial [Iphiclides podalirius]